MKYLTLISAAAVLLSGCLLENKNPVIKVSNSLADCTACHETTDTTLATGAHAAHMNSDFASLRECDQCHPDNTVGHSTIDSIVLMKDFADLESSHNCDSCHSTGIALAKTLWKQPASMWKNDTGYCRICHDFEKDFESGAHMAHQDNPGYSQEACTECHPDNLADHSPIDSIVLFKGMVDLELSGSCDSCHGAGAELAKTYWNQPRDSWKNDTGYCKMCHDVGHRLRTGAHEAHFLSKLGGMDECTLCHPDNTLEHSEIDSIVLFRNDLGFTATTDCDSCHTAGAELAKTYWNQAPEVWKTDTSYCKICHTVDLSLNTGTHGPHFRSKMGNLGECTLCHKDNLLKHTDIDSVVLFRDSVDFTATHDCDSCHTTGAELAKTFWHQSPDVWKVDTSYCKICHAVDASISTGAHESHLLSGLNSIRECAGCHPDNLAEHSPYDSIVVLKDSVDLTASIGCDTCHGTGAHTAKDFWNQAPGSWKSDTGYCMSCHDGSSLIEGKRAENKTMYDKISGHGYTGRYAQTKHGQNGPGYACQVCHDPDAPGHLDTAAGDLRLRMTNTYSELCLDCHQPGQTQNGTLGYKAVSQASRHAYEVTGKYRGVDDYQYECLACHGAHGTSNLAMIRDTIDGGLGAGPYPVIFTDSAHFDPGWKSPDSGGLVDGVCDVCHIPGQEPHSRTEKGHNHDEGETCWNCHLHTVSFDTLTTYLSSFWIHPWDDPWTLPDAATLDIAQSVNFSVSTEGNLEEYFNVSDAAAWISSDTTIFVVNDTGLITGVAEGSALLLAMYDTFADTLSVTVTSTVYLGPGGNLSILPLNPALAVGDTLVLSAQLTLPGGSVLDVTDSLTWASNNPAVAAISPVKGRIIGVGPGPVNILAYSAAGLNALKTLLVQ